MTGEGMRRRMGLYRTLYSSLLVIFSLLGFKVYDIQVSIVVSDIRYTDSVKQFHAALFLLLSGGPFAPTSRIQIHHIIPPR